MSPDADPPRVPHGLSGVPETLLVPLVGRAMARTCWPTLAFDDPYAERLVERLAFNAAFIGIDRITLHACASRAAIIDDHARDFFAAHPRAFGVALGCGLDQRPERLGGAQEWLELDLPEVVRLKRELLGERERVRLVAGSLLDAGWLSHVPRDRPVFVCAEGVLMYLPPDGVRAFFERVAESLPGASIAFDYLQSLWVGLGGVHPTMTTMTGARFTWGAATAMHVARYHPHLEVACDDDVFTRGSKRWRLLGNISRATLLGHSWLGVAHLRVRRPGHV